MDKLGKNRVFAQGSIKELGQNCVKLMNQAVKTSRDVEKELKTLKAALGEIPSEARVVQLQNDIDKIAGKLDKPVFTNCKMKTSGTLAKLMEQVPGQDQALGKKMDGVKDDANRVEKAAQNLRQLISGGVMPGNYKDFSEKIETLKVSWKLEEVWGKDILTSIIQRNKHCKGKNPANEHSKDPVNLCTGNFIYEKEELKVHGLMPLSFRRFYNALDDREGSLGKGWIHNYEARLEIEGEESCTFIKEDGAEEVYIRETEQMYRNFRTGLDAIYIIEADGLEKAAPDREEKYFYTTREGLQYTFHKNGYMLCQKDRNGNAVHFHYDGNGRLIKAETDTKEALFYTYQEDGRLVGVKDHVGRAVSMEYREEKLRRVTNPGGGDLSYSYTKEGKISGVTNTRGITSPFNRYDKHNRVCKQRFPDGGEMRYEYQDDKKQVILTERNGSRITYERDEKHRSIRNIYEDGEEQFAYNQANRKTLVVDKLGNKTRYGYDGKGNLIRIINALGVKTELQYGEHNQPTCIAVNGEMKVRNQYDEAGNLTKTMDALGNCHEITYRKEGKPKTIYQPDGSRTELDYDERGNITELKDASGSTNRYVYDDLNRIVETVDGNGNATKYAYDVEGNITQVTNANGDSRCYSYNERNKVTEIKDFDGSSIRREYNVLNRPSKVIDQLGRETILAYDMMWNLAKITEPNGAETRFRYNKLNRLEEIKNANGDVRCYAYDANGNRTKVSDGEGNETFFTYDALGRLTQVKGPEGIKYSCTYTAEGQVSSVTDALGNTVYARYDAAGRLIRETNPLGEKREYTYTPLGDPATMTDEAGRKTIYTYEPGGHLKQKENPDGTREIYRYDGNGNIKTYTDPLGNTLTYTYDSLNRVIQIKGAQGEMKSYTYDAVGNVTSMTNVLGNRTEYAYTLTGQLSRVMDALWQDLTNFDLSNTDEQKVLDSKYISAYKGQLAVRWSPNGRSGSLGSIMFLDKNATDQTIKHEAGHYVQYRELEPLLYYLGIGVPSFLGDKKSNQDYYSQPWEITADIYGGVNREFQYNPGAKDRGKLYFEILRSLSDPGKALRMWLGLTLSNVLRDTANDVDSP